MVIGDLRSVVVFEQNSAPAEDAGFDNSWSTLGTTRGQLKSKSGGRNLVTGEIESNNSYELIVRYNSSYNSVLLRALINGRYFNIHSIMNIEEGKKKFLKYTLSEKK